MLAPFEQAENSSAAKPEPQELSLTALVPWPHLNRKQGSQAVKSQESESESESKHNDSKDSDSKDSSKGTDSKNENSKDGQQDSGSGNGKTVPKDQAENQDKGNPLFPGADPDVLITDKSYWVYPTGEGHKTDSFYVQQSTDLKQWSSRGPIFNVKDIGWANSDGQPRHDLWAPGIIHANDKYYLYYSLGAPDWTKSRIGVAVSDTPDGKFKDIGRPLIGSHRGFQAIDPMVFEDPKTGDHLLYAGGAGGAKLRVFKLNPDLVSIEKEIKVDTPKNFTEGAFMHYREGKYYLSYSKGYFFNPDYSVHYASSDSPTGPWTYKGPILQSDSEHLSPGHHAFMQNPKTGDWYIAYHRWNDAAKTGKLPPSRSVAIDKLEYDKNGDILPVKMTNTGVGPAPL